MISAAECASTNDSTAKPEIANNSVAQVKSDWQNVFRLAEIGVKEGIAEGNTNIVENEITNPILWTTDNINFKLMDQFQIHQLFTAITEGAKRPESTNIRKQFVNIKGTIFDWRETVVTNVERMEAMAAKSLVYGMCIHRNLCAIVILVNMEWVAQ